MNEAQTMETEQLDLKFGEQRPAYGKRVYVYFGVIVILVLAVFIVKAQWQDHLPVSSVIVEGNTVLPKEEIIRLMKLTPRVPMYALDLTQIRMDIRSNTFVKDVVVQRDAPSQLRVVIEERTPAALLVANGLYYIDEEGIVLPYLTAADTYDIPVISGLDSSAQIKPGQHLVNRDLQEALQIIAAAKATNEDLFHAISEIRLRKGRDLVLYSFETGFPIIFGKGDVVNKIVKLDAFWQQYFHTIGAQGINYIDVRFDDQVVVSRKAS
jgi:cell division septal protein FtsQ